jgi:hypothetical protein
MGFAFRPNADIWQAVQGKKCKNKINFEVKMQESVIFGRVALQRVPLRICRNFA